MARLQVIYNDLIIDDYHLANLHMTLVNVDKSMVNGVLHWLTVYFIVDNAGILIDIHGYTLW